MSKFTGRVVTRVEESRYCPSVTFQRLDTSRQLQMRPTPACIQKLDLLCYFGSYNGD
jgi:hypothetical protein